MCGLSGFIGVPKAQAWGLVYGLGAGIDDRGGHAAGYVSIKNNEIRVNKKIGEWSDASRKFIRHAAKSETLMMHARYATCGIKDSIHHAHPFTIERFGMPVLYGAHNGIIWDGAEESAKKNGRDYTVDSREVFELLADGDYDAIQNLDGYGVLTWIEPGENHVNMVRLSKQSEISVCTLKRGGLVWASTDEILYDALDLACLKRGIAYNLPEIGLVYKFVADGVWETKLSGIKVGDREHWTYRQWSGDDKEPESWESKLIEKWEAEEREREAKKALGYEDSALLSSWERDAEQAERESIMAEDLYQAKKDRWFGARDHNDEPESDQEYPSIAGMYR